MSVPQTTARERDAWERGVVAASVMLMRRADNEAERNGIMAETMGLLHGTMGPGAEYEQKRAARREPGRFSSQRIGALRSRFGSVAR